MTKVPEGSRFVAFKIEGDIAPGIKRSLKIGILRRAEQASPTYSKCDYKSAATTLFCKRDHAQDFSFGVSRNLLLNFIANLRGKRWLDINYHLLILVRALMNSGIMNKKKL